MKSYQIHLIRHGLTAENEKGKYIGSTDIPLSQRGIDLLKKYSREFDYPGAPILYSSPLQRCTQTAAILYPSLPPRIVGEISECDFGDWEGKTAAELAGDPNFSKWLSNSTETAPPNGESGEAFLRRICKAFEKIVNGLISSGETSAVIITHGGVIMNLLSVYGIPHAKPYDWQMDNGFGYSIRINTLLWQRDKVCEVYALAPYEKNEDEENYGEWN